MTGSPSEDRPRIGLSDQIVLGNGDPKRIRLEFIGASWKLGAVQTSQLGDLRIIDAGLLSGVVSGPAAIDLRPAISPLGQRFVRFLTADDSR